MYIRAAIEIGIATQTTTSMTTESFKDDPSALLRDLVSAMRMGVAGSWSEDRFEALALRAFRHQFEANGPYRAFCEGRGSTPATVKAWTDVPAVPVAAFKAVELVCGRPHDAEIVFRTSGTTRGGRARGAHFVPSLEIYRASLIPPFRAHVVPDLDRIRFVSLVPAPSDLPDSSLSFMVDAAAQRFASEIAWGVDGEGALDEDALVRALHAAERAGDPVLLLGTAFAFVHALDRTPSPLRSLPPGSRIMETGGFKGRSRELSKPELHALLADRTGVPRERIVNEYGMTELLSQLYEPVLAEGLAGADRHRPPPWLAVRALDPTTLDPMPAGEEGILAFFDLANLGSVCHVLTEDVGSVVDGHVRLVGRTEGAEPRGCSRAMDELMSSVR
ncbi:MAG: long-chain fatty acid--CoA ligase [Gemmatimonadota bacterium]